MKKKTHKTIGTYMIEWNAYLNFKNEIVIVLRLKLIICWSFYRVIIYQIVAISMSSFQKPIFLLFTGECVFCTPRLTISMTQHRFWWKKKIVQKSLEQTSQLQCNLSILASKVEINDCKYWYAENIKLIRLYRNIRLFTLKSEITKLEIFMKPQYPIWFH